MHQQQGQVYQRIINTLQQINGQPSLLSDIRSMRQQINTLHHDTQLELSRLSTSRSKLNYQIKPINQVQQPHYSQSRQIPRDSLIFSRATQARTTLPTQARQTSSSKKQKLLSCQKLLDKSNITNKSSRYKQGKSSSTIQKNKLKRIKFRSLAYIPSNKLYKSSIIQLRSGQKLVLANQCKIKNTRGQKIDGSIYKFNGISIDSDDLYHKLLQRPGSSVMFIGHKSTGKRKLMLDWLSAQVNGLVELAKLQRNKSISSISICYMQTYANSKQSQTIQLMKQRVTFHDQAFNDAQRNILNSLQQVKQLAVQKRVKLPKLTRIRRIKLSFVDGFGMLSQELVTSNGLIRHRNQYQFLKQQDFNLVWCINPLFKFYQSSKIALQASRTLFQK